MKIRLKFIAENFKGHLEADSKKKVYLAKLKKFFNESRKDQADRWIKLEKRVNEFEKALHSVVDKKPEAVWNDGGAKKVEKEAA